MKIILGTFIRCLEFAGLNFIYLCTLVITLLASLLLIPACASATKTLPNTRKTTAARIFPVTTSPSGLIQAVEGVPSPAADYKNATYLIEGKPVTLVGGVSEMESSPGSASKTVTRYFGNEAFGDLNGDGREDVAFLLTQESGGSGTFFYVVAALLSDQGYQGANAVLLGDRIAPQTTGIENGLIVVNYAVRKPGESFTVPPSVRLTKIFQIVVGSLVEV